MSFHRISCYGLLVSFFIARISYRYFLPFSAWLNKRDFFIDFGKNETNICELTKKGKIMSFYAEKVVIVAKIGIMEIVIDFTERKKENIADQMEEIL